MNHQVNRAIRSVRRRARAGKMEEKALDDALAMTFPASDPVAVE